MKKILVIVIGIVYMFFYGVVDYGLTKSAMSSPDTLTEILGTFWFISPIFVIPILTMTYFGIRIGLDNSHKSFGLARPSSALTRNEKPKESK